MPTSTAPAPGIAGQIAVVTGAAQGIGAAVCTALATAGAKIAALDIDARLQQLADTLPGTHPYHLDVRDGPAVTATIDAIEREIGPIGILVNVAGVLHTGPVATITDEDWHQTFAVNTDGVLHTCRATAPHMITRRTGAIVTVASNAASVPRIGMAAYAASKAASAAFTRCLGLELAPYGIRCNTVSPGSTDTAMLRALAADRDPQNARNAVVNGDPAAFRIGIPLGRIATPGDIADAVLFLASDQARHITLQELFVDGGASLRP
ncbi:2,3-dihydro-2,3-dihydroxybenzoate dehydrogenase [Planomonospora sphaerica]|uniref:2,3-dihydro-2,3-dihydroxybenzoate dehydrogenase n=1 Tax=Planomonospora sphaerica TaxID=161355 RepID=A0A161LJ12_9ACTN|nr:2,3-dihydro-2,3-dihydroxybenzoate dehydrogenase [Planomonospora sphaerica]GAT68834.1 2,3-dihydro-2,3-dihydroxybenzoate dehydrogenase [Planomonospora sphaerica]